MSTRAISAVSEASRPLDAADPYDDLLDLVGTARVVLLGEATHGTRELYAERARITQRLIEQGGFSAVAVEGDWPDAERVDRFVRGDDGDEDADGALRGFRRFPTWMWRNAEVLHFVAWLREWNRSAPGPAGRVGFYGLDLYSLMASLAAVVSYLDGVDADAAERARTRYACFDHFGEAEDYGLAAAFGEAEPCEDAAVAQLVELQREMLAARDGHAIGALFSAEQNARLVRNAERYYRTLFRGGHDAWNLRDRHMVETLAALVAHLDRELAGQARVVVWAHNSHVGDARATELGEQGQVTIGQLARERYGRDAMLVGFTTYSGTVTAAEDWDRPPQRMAVLPALPRSYEALLHETGVPRFLLPLARGSEVSRSLLEPRLERAIGVVYRPRTERVSHYLEATLPDQFDAVVHLDETSAVEPLEPGEAWSAGEPETFPSGL